MMGENTRDEDYKTITREEELLAQRCMTAEIEISSLHKREKRNTIATGAVFLIASIAIIAAITYKLISQETTLHKYIPASSVEAKAMDIDLNNEGLEQLLTIDGKQYTLQEINGEPTLVKYEKKD